MTHPITVDTILQNCWLTLDIADHILHCSAIIVAYTSTVYFTENQCKHIAHKFSQWHFHYFNSYYLQLSVFWLELLVLGWAGEEGGGGGGGEERGCLYLSKVSVLVQL